ncbi:hypothetical protein AB0J48_20645 [Nocardia salmonicida]|uniref:hypothetical protein n=1 Tax=Nocardia salmonicida TaxID=53431 RepID=UPI00341E6743
MASDRDTLTEVVGELRWIAGSLVGHSDEAPAIDQRDGLMGLATRVDALASGLTGWRPPAQVITTAAELDALPVGSIILHPRGDGIPKLAAGWCVPGHMQTYTAADLLRRGPVTVLYVPTEEAESRG